jgi:hypothetical protein
VQIRIIGVAHRIGLISAIKTKRGHIRLYGYTQYFQGFNIPRNGGRVKERENRYITNDMQIEKSQIKLFNHKINMAIGVKNIGRY